MSTATRTKPSTPAPLSAHTGYCTAIRRSGASCDCEALHSPTDIGGYRTCACGHTQQAHALPDAPPRVRRPALVIVECKHPVWTYSGDSPRPYLRCNTCRAVMPVCRECGQSIMPTGSWDES